DANAQTTDAHALTPLKAAGGDDKILALLQAAGAQFDPQQEELVATALARAAAARAQGQTPAFRGKEVEAFLQAASLGQVEVIRDLVAAGMPVNTHGQGGATALRNAAGAGDWPVFRALLDAGADLAAGGPSEWPLLVLAAHGGNAEIVRLLL